MSKTTTLQTFVYSWTSGDEELVEDDDNNNKNERFVIRGFGRTADDRDVIVEIQDFPLYLYLELPSHIDWRRSKMLLSQFQDTLMEFFERARIHVQTTALLYKRKLYFFTEEEFPFFFIAFGTHADRQSASRMLIKNDVFTVFGKRLRTRCHEHEASGILQFLCFKNIPSCGWIEVRGGEKVDGSRTTYCDDIVRCSYRDIHSCPNDTVPRFKVFAFDIEVYSADHARMPQAENASDEIFQISLVGESVSYLLTIGSLGSRHTPGYRVLEFEDEKQLLLGFCKLVTSLGVHVMVGYNIFGFDIPYMLDRAKFNGVYARFVLQGMFKNRPCPEKQISWSSSAYRNQEFRFLDVTGRIVIDLLPLIRRDYKLSNYKLSTVAQHFLGADKDPVKAKDIFEFYRRYQQNHDDLGIELLATIGEYCIKDSKLVYDLFVKLQCWIGLIEMAKTCNVPIPVLYTQGQQIKVYSQIYKHCMYQKIVVEASQYHKNNSTSASQQYSGAFVFDPRPGVYDNVIPFDFAALYPTTIIAYNIDFSTLVLDHGIPDEECHVIEWTEEDNNNKHYRFRFIKRVKGVIPRMLETLLSERKATKAMMKQHEKHSFMYTVLDKRQLALKVSANSAYGIMGATKGYLPFLPGAMSTTAMGRKSITKAAEYVKKTYKGELIYGDSVCGYSPVMIRIGQRHVHVLSIEQLAETVIMMVGGYSKKYWKHTEDGKEYFELSSSSIHIETWTERGWTRLYRVIRHILSPKKRIIRVATTSGDIVDVTDDHSLLRSNGEPVPPTTLRADVDELLTTPFPEPCGPDAPSVHIITEMEAFAYGQCNSCEIPMDLLWKAGCDKKVLVAYWNGMCKAQDPSLRYTFSSENKIDTSFVPRFHTQLECQKARILLSRIGEFDVMIEQVYNHYALHIITNSSPHRRSSTQQPPLPPRVAYTRDIPYNGYVYDLTTENHHFASGIGNLVVHNTDSIYCHFPSVSLKDLWDFAIRVESEFTKLFPPPMKLAFEEKMYRRFLILTKKRYMAFTQNRDLSVDKELTIRGVLLARRDNCRWIREIYEKVVRSLMDLENPAHHSYQHIEYILQEEMIRLCSHTYDISYVTITKTVGSEYKPKAVTGYDETTGKITDIVKWKKRLAELEIAANDKQWLSLYRQRMMPAHVQLAHKMTARGNPVSAGTRIEYVMIQHLNPKAKQFLKIEDPEYVQQFSDVIQLDFLFVLNLAKNSLQQLVHVLFPGSPMVDRLISLHAQKMDVVREIRRLFQPTLRLAHT